MDRDQIDTKLRQIFSDLVDEPCEAFSYETTPDNLEKWDSLVQINLIASVEEEFSLVIPPEQQLDMLTFELVGDVLEDMLQSTWT